MNSIVSSKPVQSIDSGRYLFVDGLRGLASLSVALYHIGRDFLEIDALFLGSHGVTVFFVLSGFVICHSMVGKNVTGYFVANFALKRSVRLDPAYWVAIVLALAVAAIPAYILDYAPVLPKLQDVAFHLVYLQQLAGVEPINVVFWTLCYEVQFYLVFCILMYAAHRASGCGARCGSEDIYIPGFACLLLASLIWPLGIVEQVVPGLFVNLWYLFLLGVFARWALFSKLAARALVVAVVVVLAVAHSDVSLDLVVGFGTSVLLYLAGKFNKMRRWLSWKWVQYFGMVSYSLYLVHDIVGLYVRDTGLHLSRKYFGIESLFGNYVWCALALVVSIACAHILYIAIEAPSHEFSRRITLRGVIESIRRVSVQLRKS